MSTSENGNSAEGELMLSAAPFETLTDSIRIERACFYTLGYRRLKFYKPKAFFALPAVEVSRCQSPAEIESGLRQLWCQQIDALRAALDWLGQLDAPVQVGARGTQLLLPLPGEAGSPARMISPAEIQLPSSGPLADTSLPGPHARRHRPGPGLGDSSDLEIDIAEAMQRARKESLSAARPRPVAPSAPPSSEPPGPRILVLERDKRDLSGTEALLLSHGNRVDTFQDPERALAAFRSRSYELVLTAASLPRADGLEFIVLVRSLPGMENLPVVLMSEHFSPGQRSEAEGLGVTGFFEKPVTWAGIREPLAQILEHSTVRRFRRVPAQLQVETECGERRVLEFLEEIGRNGFRLRTQRDLFPDTVERYRIQLPSPLQPICVEGRSISRITSPGDASITAGIRIQRFLEGEESSWICLVEKLLGR